MNSIQHPLDDYYVMNPCPWCNGPLASCGDGDYCTNPDCDYDNLLEDVTGDIEQS